MRLSTGMVPNDQLSAARVTRRAASSRGGGPPPNSEEAKAPRWDACSRKAQRLLGIQPRLVGQLLGYSGRVRERFRHRSSKFIARRPPQCRALMKTKSTCNFSLKSSALTEMSISLAPWVITVTPICSDLPETTSVKFRRFACRAFVAPKTWVQVS